MSETRLARLKRRYYDQRITHQELYAEMDAAFPALLAVAKAARDHGHKQFCPLSDDLDAALAPLLARAE